MAQEWWSKDQPAQQAGGGVFVPAPGAAEAEQRKGREEERDVTRLGISQAGEARSGREEVRGVAGNLRDAFEKQKVVTDYQVALPAYNTILKLASGKPNKASDFTIITLFNKVQDPGSAVLEGERTAAQDVSTLFEKYKAQLSGLFDPETGFVSDDARKQFVGSVQALITERNRAYNAMRDRYTKIAESPTYNANPFDVVGPHFGETFVPEIEQNWGKIFPPKKEKAPAAGGSGGPQVSVSPEESIATFGQLAYDENGNLVGRQYLEAGGTIYDAQGNDIGLVGSVSEEALQEPAPSFFGGIARDVGEAITGSERSTAMTEALPDWVEMPELQQLLSIPSFKTALGTAFGGGPQEIAQIVQSNFPDTKVYQDEKGNYILQSPSTGERYAIKPGFQVSDIPRALSVVLLGAGGRGANVAQTAVREGALQAGIETTQAGTGGWFNPEDIAAATVLGGVGQKAADVLPGAVRQVSERVRNAAPPAPPATAAIEDVMGLPGGIPRVGGGVTPAPTMAPTVPPAPAPMAAPAPVVEGRTFEAGEGAPGMRGGGAAMVDEATLRAQRAQELPVPIELARFQRSRLFEEQQRARELAKNAEIGGPIRERLAEQQEALRQNFDRFVDSTGAEIASNLRETGVTVDEALRKLSRVAKSRVNVLYKRAERAGETQEPIAYQGLLDFINQQTPTTREKLAPVLKSVEEQLAKNDPNKTGLIPINALEDVRKLINKNAQEGTPDATYGRDMKAIIDGLTEGKGGELYKAARQARIDEAKLFENTAIIRDLMKMKPGTTDRAVALDRIAERAIWSGSASVDDITKLKSALDMASSRGKRAWRELQGATMEHIRDQAYKGVSRDETGQIVISPAGLNTVITSLDRAGKLDVIFDKKTAELLRTVNSVAQDMFTAPPGSVNNSNTSSAILNAVDMVVTYLAAGVPFQGGQVLNSLRKSMQERGLKKEVKRLLD